MDGPCLTPLVVHMILAVGQVANLLVSTWLAQKRKKADRDRRYFQSQMRRKHDLALTDSERQDTRRGKFLGL